MLADKAYDAARIRQLIQDHGATPNIPPKSNRRWKPCFSRRLYRERNLMDRVGCARWMTCREEELSGSMVGAIEAHGTKVGTMSDFKH